MMALLAYIVVAAIATLGTDCAQVPRSLSAETPEAPTPQIITPTCSLLQQLIGVPLVDIAMRARAMNLAAETLNASRECASDVWTAEGNIKFANKVLCEGMMRAGANSVHIIAAESALVAARIELKLLLRAAKHVEHAGLVVSGQVRALLDKGTEAVGKANEAVAMLTAVATQQDTGNENTTVEPVCERRAARNVTSSSLRGALLLVESTMVLQHALQKSEEVAALINQMEVANAEAVQAMHGVHKARLVAKGAEAVVAARTKTVYVEVGRTIQRITLNDTVIPQLESLEHAAGVPVFFVLPLLVTVALH
ncbi:unnamed protein product [Trypanosoma congolense IL3000]|uniref:WGS project CAEQ00000000 data, annotated contig 2059 n=1 Tax=Trypanosoma congolense (strain IL3000) TaxID=1068625 RepID=F9WB45_TRYCI|nr:unnamed protein product [Trypanosoma congolense IL3000]